MAMSEPLTDDAQAIVLLCTPLVLPPNRGVATCLSSKDWNQMENAISQSEWRRPGRLLGKSASELKETLGIEALLAERMAALLDRGGQLGVAISRLIDQGIWILTRADANYPPKLRQRLRHKAPAVLFGAGSVKLLKKSGIAVVGSRNVSQEGMEYAREIGRCCAHAREILFSGAARGVDRISMAASLEEDGQAVGVLADSLERVIGEREARMAMLEDRLTLVAPYIPTAPFSVASAMGRNKIIYALADFAVVVDSAFEKGGTWSGAVEDLRERWVPLFVRVVDEPQTGNAALIRRGGIPLRQEELCNGRTLPELLSDKSKDWSSSGPRSDTDEALFPIAWPVLEKALQTPRSSEEIAGKFNLEKGQVQKWLERAVKEGKVIKIRKRPSTYQIKSRQEDLFDL